MKRLLSLTSVFLLLAAYKLSAQTVIVTDDATYTAGQVSSVLDVKSVTKGFLVPRMTGAQRSSIASPADGLLVYQTDLLKGFYNYNSTTSSWVQLGAGSTTQWSTLGNAGLSFATNFLGTTDATSLRFRTNNLFRMVLDSAGSVGIGSVNFNATNREKLLVDAGVSSSVTGIYSTASINNYYQLNIKNQSNGGTASTDLVATADNGNETTNFINLGINGSGFIPGTSNPNDGYLISNGADFRLINLAPAKNIIFSTGAAETERMRLTGAGFLGIGTSAPATALHVYGVNPLTLRGVQLGANTDSVLTISSGTVRKLPFPGALTPWSTTGNGGTNYASDFLGTTDLNSLRFRTDNVERMVIDSLGNIGIGIENPTSPLVIRDSMEIRATSPGLSQISFANTGDARISSGSDDICMQGGYGRDFQLTAYWSLILQGDRQGTGTVFPAFSNGVGGTGVLVKGTRDASVPLAIQPNSAAQSVNLTEWRNASGTVLSAINKAGSFTGAATRYGTGSFGALPGGPGTAITAAFKTTVNTGTDNTSIPARGQHVYAFTVTGLNTNATVTACPQLALPNGAFIQYCYNSGTSLSIVIGNLGTTAFVLPNNTVFNISVVQ